ncbi:MAG TPA: type II toxin-antitoxin system Phd/YefM family antitoxin [bacterium]|nr:type II toxin-antitoxin system Phd/YefM family antitoxin [bacterium]
MKTISITEARATLADLLNKIHYGLEDYIITRRNKKQAVLIPPQRYLLFLELLERYSDEMDNREAETILKEVRREGTISLEQIKAELGLD